MSVPGSVVRPDPRIVAAPAPQRRPPVLDAARTALIPLRPLTVGEILDGGFLIVRRNLRLMLGLPLVVAGAFALYLLAGFGVWVLLGNSTIEGAREVLLVLMGLFGLLLAYLGLVWMTAVLSRVSLQTVLGEGFAPAQGVTTLRSARRLFWPMVGMSLLQYLAVSVLQTVVSLVYYLLLIGVALSGGDDTSEAAVAIVSIVLFLLSVLAFALAYGYVSLTVPAYAAESRDVAGWIGKPQQPTNLITAFQRSFQLVGLRNAPRVALLFAATGSICVGVVGLLSFGALALVALYGSALGVGVLELLSNPWTSIGVLAFSVLVAMSALLAYVSAVQALLYLDLRMRREGLDLALRFDRVPVPQPWPPPPVWIPYGAPGLPPSPIPGPPS